MTDVIKMSLAAQLVQAQSHAQAVAKESTNQFHRYKYASAEALIEEARGALSKAGLALITTAWHFEPQAQGQDLSAPGVAGTILVKYMLLGNDAKLEMSAETAVLVEKGRPLDKAQATALTYNLGYFLRGLLLLPREDAEEAVDARDDRPHRQEPPRASAKVMADLKLLIDSAKTDAELDGARIFIIRAREQHSFTEADMDSIAEWGRLRRAALKGGPSHAG